MIETSGLLRPRILTRGDSFRALQFDRSLAPELFDPILNVDVFEMSGPTFSAHPHAGFAAMTYLLPESQGGFDNRDSLGNALFLPPGSLHISRASSGLVHEELPASGEKPVRGLQIFWNLAAARQTERPAAIHVARDNARIADEEGAELRTVLDDRGDSDGLPNAARIVDGKLATGAESGIELPAGWGGIVLCLSGEIETAHVPLVAQTGIALRNSGSVSERFSLGAPRNEARFIALTGEQLRQPIYQSGPMIMADPETLDSRVAAYRAGEFGEIQSA